MMLRALLLALLSSWANGLAYRVDGLSVYTAEGYTGPLLVSGSMTLEQTAGADGTPAQSISWTLSGADTNCPTGTGNVCGIHVHEGTSCSVPTGGHLYNRASDPWTIVRYSSAAQGTSSGTQLVPTNLTMSDIVGRAMVVHNSVGAGERVACGIITQHTSLPGPETADDDDDTGGLGIGLMSLILIPCCAIILRSDFIWAKLGQWKLWRIGKQHQTFGDENDRATAAAASGDRSGGGSGSVSRDSKAELLSSARP